MFGGTLNPAQSNSIDKGQESFCVFFVILGQVQEDGRTGTRTTGKVFKRVFRMQWNNISCHCSSSGEVTSARVCHFFLSYGFIRKI